LFRKGSGGEVKEAKGVGILGVVDNLGLDNKIDRK